MGAKLSVQKEEVPAERTFIVTGGNTGIGYQTAKKIAQLGGRVVMASRSEEKAKKAIEKIQEENRQEVRAKRKAEKDAADKERQQKEAAAAKEQLEKKREEERKKKEEAKKAAQAKQKEEEKAKEGEEKKEEKKEEGAEKAEENGEKAEEEKPSGDGDKPAEEETASGAADKPAEEKPAEDGDKPAADGDKPAADGDKSAADGDKPAEDGDKPAENGDKPAEDGDKSAEGGTKEEAAAAAEGGAKEDGDAPKEAEPEPEEEIPELKVQFMPLDLSSFKSTLEFVKQYKESGLPLNVLICNAGLIAPTKVLTDDGLESSFQTNYLSHFLLTLHFLPLLKASSPNPKIINVSSSGHRQGDGVHLDNIQAQKSFSQAKTYGNSKLFQIMNMFTLQSKIKDTGIDVFTVHPGLVDTQFSRGYSGFLKAATFFHKGFGRNSADGAATTLTAALDEQYNGKSPIYFSSCKPVQPTSTARNEEQQKVLWRYSLELLREHLDDNLLAVIGETLESIQPKEPEPEPEPAAAEAEDKKEEEAAKGEEKGEEAEKATEEKVEEKKTEDNPEEKKEDEAGKAAASQETEEKAKDEEKPSEEQKEEGEAEKKDGE